MAEDPPSGKESNATTSVSRTHRPYVFVAIIMAMFMAAVEATIVATSMPSIVAKLGGISLYSWVFSSYLLMQAVSIPIYGKLSDLFGRKHVFMFGVSIFLVGSVLCGFAWSMQALIAFRFIQGMGAGAVQPLAVTLIGDLYTLEERGRVQGYTASLWGIASIVGPLAGALIVQYVDWAWIFWVNIPFGLVAIVLVSVYLHEGVGRKQHHIDYLGAALLLVTLASLMLALTHAADWGLGAFGGLLALTLVSAGLFFAQEARAPEPVMDLALWKSPLISLANAATLTSGIAMIGIITFLPTFVQGALGVNALVAGLTLSAMLLAWPLASTATGLVLVRVGTRRLSRLGGAVVFAGALVIALFAASGPPAAAAGAALLGIGLGILSTTFIVAIQTIVPWAQRGAATASNILMRILGNALGAALFGGVLNFLLQRNIAAGGLAGTFSIDSVQGLLGGDAHNIAGGADAAALLSGPAGDALRAALAAALNGVFWGAVAAAVVTLAITLRMPDVRLEAESRGSP